MPDLQSELAKALPTPRISVALLNEHAMAVLLAVYNHARDHESSVTATLRTANHGMAIDLYGADGELLAHQIMIDTRGMWKLLTMVTP